MIRPRSLGQSVVIALAFAISAAAQEYSFRFYGRAEGLQSLVVLSLAQDRQGFIWAGAEGGLYRYDGTRFRLMGQEQGLPCSTEVHSLFVALDGALWANTCNAIFRFDGKRFLPIPGVDRMPRGAQMIADGADGSMLISTSAGLYEALRNRDGSFSTRPHSLPEEFAGKPTHGILRHGSSLWFGCDQQLCMEEAGRISVFGKEQDLPEDAWDGIQISQDGAVWVRSLKAIYRRGPHETRFSRENPDLASSGFWGALTLGRDDSILVPTDQGLAIHTKAGWAVVNRQHGLRKENTIAALEDRQGTLWLGLANGGVARWIGRGVWESWTTDQGLPGDVVWSIRRDKRGSLWVGTGSGLARIDGSGRIRTWNKKDGLGSDNVRWLAETSDNAIWAAAKPGGLARIDPVSGKVRPLGSNDGLPCDPEDLFVDGRDRMWLPTLCGLFVNERPSVSNRVTRVDTPESFGRFAWKVIEDKQGTIWVTNRYALWSWREGQWREHRRPQGLLTDNPYVMVLAGDGSIWMRHRYDAGIDRLEVSEDRIVRATAVMPANSKAPDGTAFHGFDALGDFWRGSANGVAVLHDNRWTTFTTEDGLISNDCDGEAFWADTDGVWLGTSSGLAHYRPENRILQSPMIADPIISRLEINPSTRLTRAEFSSLNYKAEQLARFAYRIDQAPWTDLAERTISISGLGPGRHRLEVRSRVRDGPFSASIAAAEFRLEPRWNETWWTRLVGLACLLGTMTQFVRWRLRAAAQKQAELEAIVAVRTTSLSKANHSLEGTASQLRRSEDRLKNAERLAHVGHWDWDVRANAVSWSEELYRIFDLPTDHTPTYESFLQAVAPQDRERLERRINECLAKRSGDTIEFQITRRTGDARIIRCTSAVSLDQEGLSQRLFGACQDITDSRRAQEEDLARQKLESLGTLASGIAHDFNNLLGGVLAQAELGLTEAKPGSFPGEELAAIRRVAIRGSEIVRQLMIYAGKEADVLGMVDVSQIVLEMLELLKVSVSKRATLISDLGPDLPAVRANASHIRQIVMNLVTNASEALEDRDGTILVTTRRVSSGTDSTVTKGLTEAYEVQLTVSDTGRGISPEMQAKVLDPFFSTKGAGHGLGLAVVHGIVRSLRGSIHIASEPGHGTTFRVLLPCAETAAELTPEPIFDVGKSPSPPLKSIVLVVEDEDALRQPVASMLRRTGFTVLEAADGALAIELLRANGEKIDLILLDMTIPGASSQEVLAEAARVRPNIRVIVTSAYSLEMLNPPVRASQIHGFLRKPYLLGDLVHTLRKAASA